MHKKYFLLVDSDLNLLKIATFCSELSEKELSSKAVLLFSSLSSCPNLFSIRAFCMCTVKNVVFDKIRSSFVRGEIDNFIGFEEK